MNDAATHLHAAGASIVAGAEIALRYLFVLPAKWNDEGAAASAPPLALDLVHSEIERSPLAAQYVDPLASFYTDVTIPLTTRRRLPVAALAEPLDVSGRGARSSPIIEIEIAPLETAWEGHTATVSPVTILARFMDSVTLFDSGHVVYTPALVLQPWDGDEYASMSHDTRAQHLSALTSLVGTPGISYHRGLDGIRSKITFRLRGETSGQSLLDFIKRRLALLCHERSTTNVFADLIRPVLMAARWSNAQRARARAQLSDLTWTDLRSASVEIVGAAYHDDVVNSCRMAKTGALTVGVGERALAALGQNVLDVHNQDRQEVVDSLSQAIVSDEHVLLIHPTLAVLYSRTSRSFAKMRDAIGGCPYVMLTNVIVAYNEYQLEQSAKLVDQIKQAIHNPRWADPRGAASARSVREDLAARVQLFENQTLHVLPNIFRYPAERTMFDEIVSQRGLGQRAAGIERFTRNLYELRKDFIDLAEREGTRRTNRLLMALGILQVSGLFLAGLSLDELKTQSPTVLHETVRAVVWGLFAVSLVVGATLAARAFWRR